MTYEAWRISYQSSEQAARAAYAECVQLRAKIEQMEKKEPVAWLDDGTCRAGSASTALRVVTEATKQDMPASVAASFSVPLYAIPGAQHAPSASEDGLPDRDSARPAEQQGLFRKFVVRRTDGSDAPGGKHYGCRYFVLDVDHDKHAVAALTAYAKACETTHPDLAKDLREKWGAQPAPSVPEGWLSVPERLVDMFCGAADNLGDMPISEAWAERWSNEASDLLEKHNYFSKHAAPKPEGE